jgi:hypothetical protein
MMGIAAVACFGLMVAGVILYQIDARAAGGFLHPSSVAMANLVLWRWGIVCPSYPETHPASRILVQPLSWYSRQSLIPLFREAAQDGTGC